MKHKPSDDQPMAMFVNYKNKLMLANSDHIDNSFQASAERCYDINIATKTGKDEIKKWTSHSLRVGACVLMHLANATTLDIQFRLRWKSDCFKIYLRDLQGIAICHKNQIISIITDDESDNNDTQNSIAQRQDTEEVKNFPSFLLPVHVGCQSSSLFIKQ